MQYFGAPRNTLGGILKSCALTANLDRSCVRIRDVATAVQKSGMFGEQTSPDMDAFTFYLYNHAASVIQSRVDPLEPLSANAATMLDSYREQASLISARVFWYVFIICTREARHNKSDWSAKLHEVHASMLKDYPTVSITEVEEMWKFTTFFPDSSEALTYLLQDQCADFQIGPFVSMLTNMYYRCLWGNSYGGPKWGHISKCLQRYISGEWSAEVFTDTAFTLAHNTAPIFNKGMLYSGPSNRFEELLDVQRAGMVPQWAATDANASVFRVTEPYARSVTIMPELFQGTVDWNLVSKFAPNGGLDKYAFKDGFVHAPPPKTVMVDAMTNVPIIDRTEV